MDVHPKLMCVLNNRVKVNKEVGRTALGSFSFHGEGSDGLGASGLEGLKWEGGRGGGGGGVRIRLSMCLFDDICHT